MGAMTRTEEALLGEAIAGLNAEAFPAALLAWLRGAVACDSIAAIAYFQDRRPTLLARFTTHPTIHARTETDYVEVAYLLDPFHDLHVARAAGGLYRLADIAPDHFQRTQYFTAYYRETTLADEMAFVCYPAGGVSVHVCLGRYESSRARFTARQIANARRLSPIVAALVARHWSGLATRGKYLESDTIARLLEAVGAHRGVTLTPRQTEVALYILKGHSSASTGLGLGISPQTVKVFRKQLYKRLNISSQAELFTMLAPLLGHGGGQGKP